MSAMEFVIKFVVLFVLGLAMGLYDVKKVYRYPLIGTMAAVALLTTASPAGAAGFFSVHVVAGVCTSLLVLAIAGFYIYDRKRNTSIMRRVCLLTFAMVVISIPLEAISMIANGTMIIASSMPQVPYIQYSLVIAGVVAFSNTYDFSCRQKGLKHARLRRPGTPIHPGAPPMPRRPRLGRHSPEPVSAGVPKIRAYRPLSLPPGAYSLGRADRAAPMMPTDPNKRDLTVFQLPIDEITPKISEPGCYSLSEEELDWPEYHLDIMLVNGPRGPQKRYYIRSGGVE